MSTGYMRKIDDLNRAARLPAQFQLDDLVKLTDGRFARITRAPKFFGGSWSYRAVVTTRRVPRGSRTRDLMASAKVRDPLLRWAGHELSVRERKILRRVTDQERATLPKEAP